MKIFLIRLIAFSGVISMIDFLWNVFVPESQIPHIWIIILVFFSITLLFHSIIMNNADARPQVIVRSYMTGTVVRLFLYILILLLYRFVEKETLVPFAIAFVLHYFIFTGFEVMALMKNFRQ